MREFKSLHFPALSGRGTSTSRAGALLRPYGRVRARRIRSERKAFKIPAVPLRGMCLGGNTAWHRLNNTSPKALGASGDVRNLQNYMGGATGAAGMAVGPALAIL